MANELRADRRRTRLAALLALALTLAVFQGVGRLGYVNWDDPLHVCDNPYLNPVTVPHVLHFWRKPYHNLFIPLSYTLYALLALAARGVTPLATPREGITFYDPHVFHTANLVLHLLNVLLVFGLLRRIVRSPWAALGGAVLFGVHPGQVESVAWISELRGLLGSFLSLAALGLYLEFALEPPTPENVTRRRWLYGGALACFVLALLAKPSAVATPVLALLLDSGVARRGLKSILESLSGWGIAAAACAWMTRAVQHVPAALLLPLWQRPFIAGDALAFYLAKTVLPWQLGIDYGRSPLFVLHHAWGYATWLVPAAAGLLLWHGRRRFPMLGLAAALFVAGLLPTLGLVPFIFQNYSTVADRYLYLALLGPALALAWGLSRATTRTGPVLCAAVLIALAGRSLTQVPTWTNSETLFRHALVVYPDSAGMHNQLGLALKAEGRWAEATAHYRQSLRLRPDFIPAHFNLAFALAQQGQTEAAIAEYHTVLRVNPSDPECEAGLGEALLDQRRVPQATALLRAALAQSPDDPRAHNALALALADRGRTAAAVAEWRQVVRLRPDDSAVHYNLALALAKLGDRAAAQSEWHTALRLSPNLRLAQVVRVRSSAP